MMVTIYLIGMAIIFGIGTYVLFEDWRNGQPITLQEILVLIMATLCGWFTIILGFTFFIALAEFDAPVIIKGKSDRRK